MPVSHEALSRFVEVAYSISVEPEQILRLSSDRNALFQLTDNNKQTWIAKLAITNGEAEQIKREAEMLYWLQSCDSIITPSMLLDTAGATWTIPDIHQTALFVRESLSGSLCPETPTSYALVGAALAQLHKHLDALDHLKMSLSPCVINPFQILQNAADRLPSWTDNPQTYNKFICIIDFLRERFTQTRSAWDQEQLGHGDAHICNLIQTGNNQVHWFDFEDAYLGPRAYDLGTMIWSTLRNKQSQPLWQSALEAYNNHIHLNQDILRCLSLFVALRQIWWLDFHAQHWGRYTMHSDRHSFFEEGLALTKNICRDACGMP